MANTSASDLQYEESKLPISTGSTYFISHDEESKFVQAANNEDVNSVIALYRFYRFSKLSMEQALPWLQKAAELGDGISQYNLAYYHYQNKEIDMARKWALIALNNGVSGAVELLD